jgi:cytochrome c556
MKKATAAFLCAAVLTGSLTYSAFAADEAKKGSTKQVMKDHFKGDTSDLKKAVKGELSKEQVSTLLAAVKNLPGNKPPKGDDASWKEKSEALVAAMEKLDKGEAGAGEAVKTAANCKACHDVHKGK